MTWEEANVSLQLAAEERHGFVVRKIAAMQRAQEDAAYDALKGVAGGPR